MRPWALTLTLSMYGLVGSGCGSEPAPPKHVGSGSGGGQSAPYDSGAALSTAGGSGTSAAIADAARADAARADDARENEPAAMHDDSAPDDSTPMDEDDGGFPPDAAVGSCDPQRWTVTASSSADSNPPGNAVDGLPSTRWSSGAGQTSEQYYQIDFGGYVVLSQILLDNTGGSAGDYPRGYEVRVSRDGTNFNQVVATSDANPPDGGSMVGIDISRRAVRYLRIQLTGSSGSWWSIHELGTNCIVPDGHGGLTDAAADGTLDNLLCSGKAPNSEAGDAGDPFNPKQWTATASSTSSCCGDAVLHAFDGDITTRWASGKFQMGDEWFKVDLGSTGCIGQLWLVAGSGDFPVAYSVEVSIDDISYRKVTQAAGSSFIQSTFKQHMARYVRINQLGVSNAHWWNIQELVVKP